jgi:hypothetical protein
VTLRALLALFLVACGGVPFTAREEIAIEEEGDAGFVGGEGGAASDGGVVRADAGRDGQSGEGGGGMDAGLDGGSHDAAAPDAAEAACAAVYTRSDGQGQSFPSCDPPGVYSAASALEACVAYAQAHDAGAGACEPGIQCGNGPVDRVAFSPLLCTKERAWGYTDVAGEVFACDVCTSVIGSW